MKHYLMLCSIFIDFGNFIDYYRIILYTFCGGDSMARPKKSPDDKAIRLTISVTPDELDQLETYCQRNEFQPSMSFIIRRALDEYFKNHPNP